MGNVNILERSLVHAKNIIGWIAKEFQEVSVTPTLMIPKQIAIRAFRHSLRHTHTHTPSPVPQLYMDRLYLTLLQVFPDTEFNDCIPSKYEKYIFINIFAFTVFYKIQCFHFLLLL